MSLDHYQNIMDGITLSTALGTEMEGKQAYYSSSDPPRWKKISGETLPFQGAIGRCRCIDCTLILAGIKGTPSGLHGGKIAFAAGSKPTQQLYQRSSNHRGTRGLLRKGFWCRIDMPLWAE